MDEILKIRNLFFNYSQKIVFEDLNLTLNYNDWYTLLGNNGSGKTTLVKIICGLLDFNGKIEFNFLDLNSKNISEIRTRMAVLFDDIDNQIIEDNVFDEITFQLKNMQYSKNEIIYAIDVINKFTHIKDIIEKEIIELTQWEKCLLILTSALIIHPKLLIIDETFSQLQKEEQQKLYNIILEYKKENKLTVLNITHDSEDTLLGDNIIVIEDHKVIYNERVEKIYDDRVLETKEYKLPFIVELSNALKLYNLINKNYYNIEELVDELWK